MKDDNPPPEDKYNVGYGKPPKEHQFKKGKSGNPRGRKKKSRNFAVLLSNNLKETITVTKNGKPQKMTAQEAIILALVVNAIKGKDKAVERIFKLLPEQTPAEKQKQQAEFLDSKLATMTEKELDAFINTLVQLGSEPAKDLPSSETPASQNEDMPEKVEK